MRKSAPVVLALVAVALLGAPAPASAQPTLTLARDCSRFPPLHGLSLRLTGFPPTTPFQGTLARPTGSVLGPVGLITDPAGSFSIGPFTDESAGTWTATIAWSGGTLVQSLFVDCAPPATADQCKDGGWRTFGVFRNQGDCVGFVTTRGKNEAGRNVPEPPGASNPNREDSVTGSGTTNCLGGTFEVDARSGAGGEHPTGHVTCGTFFSGPVTCLNVTGNVALLNITTTDFGPLALRITDNGASGDRVEAIPGPGCAAPQPSYLDLGFGGGDIAVVDNGPRLARPQAGQ
jgi:hypothetical protein